MTVPVAEMTYISIPSRHRTYRVVAAEYSDGSVEGVTRGREYSWKRKKNAARFEMLNRCHSLVSKARENSSLGRIATNERTRAYLYNRPLGTHILYIRDVFSKNLQETSWERRAVVSKRKETPGEDQKDPGKRSIIPTWAWRRWRIKISLVVRESPETLTRGESRNLSSPSDCDFSLFKRNLVIGMSRFSGTRLNPIRDSNRIFFLSITLH